MFVGGAMTLLKHPGGIDLSYKEMIFLLVIGVISLLLMKRLNNLDP